MASDVVLSTKKLGIGKEMVGRVGRVGVCGWMRMKVEEKVFAGRIWPFIAASEL